MDLRTIFQKIVSLGTALGRNFIPLGAVWLAGNTSETGMILYLLETFLAVLLAALYVRFRAPAHDRAYQAVASSKIRIVSNGRVSTRYDSGSRKSLLQGFLIFSAGFGLIPALFFVFWLFLLRTEISIPSILMGLGCIAFFQVVNFISDFFLLGALTPQRANDFINQRMGRVALIYASIFIGLLLGFLFSIEWFIYPFAVLKTIQEIAFIFQRQPSVATA